MTQNLRHHCRTLSGLIATVTLIATAASIPAAQQPGMPADAATVHHVLNRIGFGPRPGDVERVQAMGLEKYIEQQLHPERIPDSALETRLSSFTTLTMSTKELADEYYIPALQVRRAAQARERATPPPNEMSGQAMEGSAAMPAPAPAPRAQAVSPEARAAQMAQQNVMNELMQAKMLRAVESEHQLEEVLVDFWFNHFNVFVGKGQVRQYLTEYERDAIRPHVFGTFREMLGAVAHSPAMLFYLDNWQSASPTPVVTETPELRRRLEDSRLTPEQRARLMARLNQRPQARARGLNENYARELMELHTLGVDGGYTQNDVIALARIFTGWTIDRPQQGGTFMFRAAMHDTGTKTFLGRTFAASGESEGNFALDLLAKHPATARHIAFKLAQRFVADAPPPALVERAAKTFLDSGGNLRDVVRVIVSSPEFFSPDARRAKMKTPFEFVTSAVRAVDARVENAQPLVMAMRDLGMPLYGCQPPTGYSMTADAWVNTGALLNRMNFGVQLLNGGRPAPGQISGRAGANRPAAAARQAAGRPGRGQMARAPLQVNIEALAPGLTAEARQRVIDTVLAGHASEATRQTLARADSPVTLVSLALGSPEFQRR